MPAKNPLLDITHYLHLIIKNRWYIIISFGLSMIVGIYLAITLPKVYESSTLILIEPQSVPENYVRSIVESDISTRINTIQEQVLSRSNIESIINKFNLFSNSEPGDMYMEDKVQNIRKKVNVLVGRARRGSNAFSISYKDSDPETAMNVANGLAALFIDENIKLRETQAIETSKFLDDEARSMRMRLEDVEAKMKTYRKRHMGELPEQLDANLRIIERLQMQLNDSQKNLRDANYRFAAIEKEIKLNNELNVVQNTGDKDQHKKLGKPTLFQLKDELADLEAKYTDQHPDVIRLRAKLAKLESKYKSKIARTADEEESPKALSTLNYESLNINRDLIRQQTEIKLEIEDLVKEIADLKNEIKKYQIRVERTPKREEELMSLNRDYENIQASYNSLLNRKLEAEIAANMEIKQKGEQFRIVDHASLPRRPASPDLQRLFLFTLAAGLGMGLGVIFLLDFLNNSVKKIEEFESDFDIALFATIPKVYQPKDIRLKRLNIVLTVFSVGVAFCLFLGFALLVFVGVESTIEKVRPYIAFF